MRPSPSWLCGGSVGRAQVVDEAGRRRFHGAFTGGFSAGYFNTVGSKEGMRPCFLGIGCTLNRQATAGCSLAHASSPVCEIHETWHMLVHAAASLQECPWAGSGVERLHSGWAPSQFVSSRANRASNRAQRPEDFMDEEEKEEATRERLAPAAGFDGFGFTAREVEARAGGGESRGAEGQAASAVPGGETALESLLAPVLDSIGEIGCPACHREPCRGTLLSLLSIVACLLWAPSLLFTFAGLYAALVFGLLGGSCAGRIRTAAAAQDGVARGQAAGARTCGSRGGCPQGGTPRRLCTGCGGSHHGGTQRRRCGGGRGRRRRLA